MTMHAFIDYALAPLIFITTDMSFTMMPFSAHRPQSSAGTPFRESRPETRRITSAPKRDWLFAAFHSAI